MTALRVKCAILVCKYANMQIKWICKYANLFAYLRSKLRPVKGERIRRMNRGEILRDKRKAKGSTQAEAAKGIGGVSLRSYVSYEKGKEPRDKMFWARAAKYFGCDVEDFGLSISEDDAFDSYELADVKASRMKGLALDAAVGLASFAVGGPLLAAASLSFGAASYAVGLFMGHRDAMNEAFPDEEALRTMVEKHRRFIRAAKGIVYMALIEHGIVPTPEEPADDGPELIIKVETGSIKSWWLCFEEGVVGEDDPHASFENEFRANAAMARFWNFAPDPTRKASVVVEDEDLFDKLMTHKGDAYRGNLSVILVDIDDARLVREEYLTTFEESADEASLMRVAH